MWKIDNFEQRRREAIDGTTLSLYSIPFYVSKQAYKMCARVYLNGDGMGKGTHLSLFVIMKGPNVVYLNGDGMGKGTHLSLFVIMKGPNDPLLPWPFQQKVTLLLGSKNAVDRSILSRPSK